MVKRRPTPTHFLFFFLPVPVLGGAADLFLLEDPPPSLPRYISSEAVFGSERENFPSLTQRKRKFLPRGHSSADIKCGAVFPQTKFIAWYSRCRLGDQRESHKWYERGEEREKGRERWRS